MPLKIDWTDLSQHEWESLFKQAPLSNYYQSWAWGEAVKSSTSNQVKRGVIIKLGHPIGLVQVTQKSLLFNKIKLTQLTRGPIWLSKNVSPQDKILVFKKLRELFKTSWMTRFLVIPELQRSKAFLSGLKMLKYTKKIRKSFATSILAVSRPLADIRNACKTAWKQALDHFQQQNIQIQEETCPARLDQFLKAYDTIRRWQNMTAPSGKVYQAFLKELGTNFILLSAYTEQNLCLGSILIVLHGQSATYLIGTFPDENCKNKAAYGLLWHAIERLHQAGYQNLDLGGAHMDKFEKLDPIKSGLNGDEYCLLGTFV